MHITVKDLLDYLKNYPDEMVVLLDKNEWDVKDTPEKTIHSSGIFLAFKKGQEGFLVINN